MYAEVAVAYEAPQVYYAVVYEEPEVAVAYEAPPVYYAVEYEEPETVK